MFKSERGLFLRLEQIIEVVYWSTANNLNFFYSDIEIEVTFRDIAILL